MPRSEPVFVGETAGGRKIVLRLFPHEDVRYRPKPEKIVRLDFPEDRYQLVFLDEETIDLTDPDVEVYPQEDSETYRLVIRSPEWSGTATGTMKELAERVELEKRYRR